MVNPRIESRWAEALREEGPSLRRLAPGPARERVRGRLWEILSHALIRALRRHCSSLGQVADDVLLDLASEKALDLLGQIDQGVWAPQEASAAQTAAFVTRVARNGLVDWLRREGRLVRSIDLDVEHREALDDQLGPSISPEESLEQEQFALALLECASGLKERGRRAWLFRVLYEMSSADIGRHPQIQAKPSSVDMMISRARQQVRQCLRKKGFGSDDIGPGVFVTLWEKWKAEDSAAAGEEP